MAKTKIEVDLVIKGGESVEQVEQKTKSLKTQLKEMKALLASGTLDNAQFTKLSKEAGQLQDKIGDVNQQVKNLASDSKRLDGLISITQGIVGGFAAVQGITAMVGTENEDLQKTMVKLQGAMSALAGIQAVANTLNKTSAAYTTANTIATNISTFAQKRYAAAVGTTTGAMRLLRIAGAALGIGLIIGAIALLVTNFDKLKSTVGKFIPSLDTLSKGFKAAYNAVTDFIGISSEGKRKVEEFEKANNKKNKSLENEIEILEAIGGKEEQIYRKKSLIISNNILQLERQKLQGIVSAEEYQTKLEELRQEDKVLEAQHNKQILDSKKKVGKEKVVVQKTVKEELKLEQQDSHVQLYLDNVKQGEEDMALLMSQLEAEVLAEQEATDKKLALEKQLFDNKLNLTRDGLNALSDLTSAFAGKSEEGQRRAFAVNKALNISTTIIDTYLSAQKAYASQLSIPTPDAPIRAQIAAGIATASGLARVVAIGRTEFGGKGVSNTGGGGGGIGGGNFSSQPPRIDTFQSNRNPMSANQRVYVLEKDITDSQGRVARIRHNATLI